MSGLVHLVRKGKGFLVINQVDLEEYVKGVVPAEVNSAWHPEMLKAQAVAARTYALYQQMLSAAREYDVVATVQDQVYKGKNGIDAAVLRAVDETRGLVLTYQNAPIYAAFSSTAAGLTEDAMNVWSKEYPYLKGVECPFDLKSPYYQWKASFRLDNLEQNLRQQGFSVGAIASMEPLSFSRGGRVAKLRVVHSDGELIFRGEELRKAVGYTIVPSTQFTIDSIGQDIVLSGYGAGHAVGMCQWGAKELAELGYPFSTILRIIIRVPNCRICRSRSSRSLRLPDAALRIRLSLRCLAHCHGTSASTRARQAARSETIVIAHCPSPDRRCSGSSAAWRSPRGERYKRPGGSCDRDGNGLQDEVRRDALCESGERSDWEVLIKGTWRAGTDD